VFHGPTLRLTSLLALLALLLGACTQSTVFYGAQAHELHGKRILLLPPSLITPTPPALQQHVTERLQAAMAKLPDLGPVLDAQAAARQPGFSLDVRDAYVQYANTLSLTGISDPDLSSRLAKGLGVDLLAQAQPVFVPCDRLTCEEGDELWFVGQVIDAHSGRLVFRAHLHAPASGSDAAALTPLADSMTQEYLDDLEVAFRQHAHRERFANLKRLAAR